MFRTKRLLTNLYDVLGVGRDATREAIRLAYRRLVKKHHPDVGGSREAWAQLLLAHDVLTDPERKDKYDKTGEYSEEKPLDIVQMAALSIISQLINNMIMTDVDLTVQDLRKVGIDYLKDGIKGHQQHLKVLETAHERATKIAGRWRSLGEENQLEGVVRAQFAVFEDSRQRTLVQIQAYERAIQIFEAHTFKFDTQNFVIKMDQNYYEFHPVKGVRGLSDTADS